MRLCRELPILAVVALSLAGCTAGPPQSVEATASPALEMFLAVQEHSTDVVPQARFDGTLALTERGCLGVAFGDGARAAIFPAGTALQADGSGITTPVGDIDLGDAFTAAGGEFAATELTDGEIPPACEEDRMLLLFPR